MGGVTDSAAPAPTPADPPATPRRRWPRIALAAAGIVALLLVVTVGAFPFSTFKGRVEGRLTERFGRPVTIGSLERAESFSFTPTLIVRDLTVPQADWAGTGALARVESLSIRLNAWALLLGQFRPSAITVQGATIDLVRDAQGRTNWRKEDAGQDTAGGNAPALANLSIRDLTLRYRDAKRDRQATLSISADAVHGVVASGTGQIVGAPVRLAFKGPPIETKGGRNWPFEAQIEGDAIAMRLSGTMARALDTDRMAFRMTARADDLKRIDAVIEAGLFGTQPVALSADVSHDDPVWSVRNLTGTVGNSDIAGAVTVRKEGGRTKLEGEVRSRRMNFADLASDEGQAKAAARVAREGLKIVPPTRVNLSKIGRTDGRIAFTIDRIVTSERPSSIRGVKGVLVLDDRRLTVAPLTVALNRGTIEGEVVVDQRDGAPKPQVTLALDMKNSSIGALTGAVGAIDARVDARVRLVGRGDTVREAVGASDGHIGIHASNGQVPERMAALLGFDVARGLFADKEERVALRCASVRLTMRRGTGTIGPLVVDTSMSQTNGTGQVFFPQEAIRATLTGAPKRDGGLRLPGSINAGGTIRSPAVIVPRETLSVGNVLKAIGRAIGGNQGPVATDADCRALAARVLG